MKEQILKLGSEGKTYNEIKVITGCSKGTIAYHLGVGQKDKYKAANSRRRQKDKLWIEEIKKELKCETCGEGRFWVLDFHHIDPELKDYSISQLMRRSTKNRVLEEMSKCKILCANCHRDLHYQQKASVM